MPSNAPPPRLPTRWWPLVTAGLALGYVGVVLAEDLLLGRRLPFEARYWAQVVAFAPLFLAGVLARFWAADGPSAGVPRES
ncbi:hypothetical protein J0H58_29685 [bacterium]|nr:hypothetical protein [bacterium]